MFDLSFLFPFSCFFLYAELSTSATCVYCHGISYVTPIHLHIAYSKAADLLTLRTEGLTLSVQVRLFRLDTDYTYASAAEVQGIRVLSHDVVLTPL